MNKGAMDNRDKRIVRFSATNKDALIMVTKSRMIFCPIEWYPLSLKCKIIVVL